MTSQEMICQEEGGGGGVRGVGISGSPEPLSL